MKSTNACLISGFKHFKAVKESNFQWVVHHIKNGTKVGRIIAFEGRTEWRINLDIVAFTWEQLLDLGGLIKSVSRIPKNVEKEDPVDDRLKLYQYIKTGWRQFIADTSKIDSNLVREAFVHPKTGAQLYVSIRLRDGDIASMDFYRSDNYIGKMSIKLVRSELSFYKKLNNL